MPIDEFDPANYYDMGNADTSGGDGFYTGVDEFSGDHGLYNVGTDNLDTMAGIDVDPNSIDIFGGDGVGPTGQDSGEYQPQDYLDQISNIDYGSDSSFWTGFNNVLGGLSRFFTGGSDGSMNPVLQGIAAEMLRRYNDREMAGNIQEQRDAYRNDYNWAQENAFNLGRARQQDAWDMSRTIYDAQANDALSNYNAQYQYRTPLNVPSTPESSTGGEATWFSNNRTPKQIAGTRIAPVSPFASDLPFQGDYNSLVANPTTIPPASPSPTIPPPAADTPDDTGYVPTINPAGEGWTDTDSNDPSQGYNPEWRSLVDTWEAEHPNATDEERRAAAQTGGGDYLDGQWVYGVESYAVPRNSSDEGYNQEWRSLVDTWEAEHPNATDAERDAAARTGGGRYENGRWIYGVESYAPTRPMARGGLVQHCMAKGGKMPKISKSLKERRASGGQKDDVPINASEGEYIFDADIVAALGDGNTDAGAAILDEFRKRIRAHKRSASPDDIPPKALSIEAYLGGV